MKLQIKQMPDMCIIGKLVHPSMDMKENPIPAFWDKCFSDGTFTRLEELSQYHIDSAYAGWMSDWDKEDGKFTYMCGMLMKPEIPLPEGYVCRNIPSATVAIGWIQGPEKEVYSVAHEFTQNSLEEQGYIGRYQCPLVHGAICLSSLYKANGKWRHHTRLLYTMQKEIHHLKGEA